MFTIYLTQSAHTDIGYTHPQDQIQRMYLDYYDRVLALCRQTENDPPERRFKWVCETFWQARRFLEHCPQREAELLHFARRGQIEITAGYLHFTDLVDPQAYARSAAWAVEYCRKNDLPLKCAMHADINGWPWAVADILAELGIPYFISHVHIDSATDPLGERGSLHYAWTLPQAWGEWIVPEAKIRIPQAFWWQGPAGGRVLHWLNEHYHLGNFLGLSGARGFPGVKKSAVYYDTDRMTADELYAIARRAVPAYVQRLKEAGYPYDRLIVSASGFLTDNSAPDLRLCQVVEKWNAEQAENGDIRLRTATLSEWFETFPAAELERLPVYQTAWPDHWAHGLGSETACVAMARQTQRRRPAATALVKACAAPQAARFLEKSFEEELFSLEHTFNAWSTTRYPGSPLIAFSQAVKQLTFHRAAHLLDEAIAAALRQVEPQRPPEPAFYVFSGQERAGLRTVHFEAVDYALDPDRQALEAPGGARFPFQLDEQAVPTYVAALPLAPGLNRFRLVDSPAAPANARPVLSAESLENEAWQIQVNAQTGGLSRLVERASGRNWVMPASEYGFGQWVHETVVHPLGREAVGNPARLIALGVASEKLRAQMTDEPVFRRAVLRFDRPAEHRPGPVFDAIRLAGHAEVAGEVVVEWRLYHALPVVELSLDWEKRWCDLPEAAYVVFPFRAPRARLALETGGGFFAPGSHGPGGQLPGTCSSYYTVQRAARIELPQGSALLWLPLDAPLVMTNAVDYNRWETGPYAWNGLLASMPVNHYWHTNFPASQRGHLRLRYRLARQAGGQDGETALQAALPVEVYGWR